MFSGEDACQRSPWWMIIWMGGGNKRGGGVANCPGLQLCLWTSCMRCVNRCPVRVCAHVSDLIGAPPWGLAESVLDDPIGVSWVRYESSCAGVIRVARDPPPAPPGDHGCRVPQLGIELPSFATNTFIVANSEGYHPTPKGVPVHDVCLRLPLSQMI